MLDWRGAAALADCAAGLGGARSSSTVYRLFFRLVLCRLPAEWVHRVAFGLLRVLAATPAVGALVRWLCAPKDPILRVRAFGRELPSPVGLAAGFDKDAEGFNALADLGFGFVEVGTVTPLPQPGNPRPRLWRLPADGALLNRMGFNNHGAAHARARLSRKRRALIGVNVGKNRQTPAENAASDYVRAAETLGQVADYLVVNVSSPNTPGLRELQNVDVLRGLLTQVKQALSRASARPVPLLVKIDPDLSDAAVDAVADLVLELGLDGIVATNTTLDARALKSPKELVGDPPRGGISGQPLARRSLEVLERLHAKVKDRLLLISVGGVFSADDVWERLRAGATLVQVYTAFVYGGPFFMRRLNRELAARLRREGSHPQAVAGGPALPVAAETPTTALKNAEGPPASGR